MKQPVLFGSGGGAGEWSSIVSITAPAGARVTISGGGEVIVVNINSSGDSYAVPVHNKLTSYTVTALVEGQSNSETFTTTNTEGELFYVSIEFGTINLTVGAEFIAANSEVTCQNQAGTKTITPQYAGDAVGGVLVFHVPDTDTWIFSADIGSDTYTVEAVVSDLDVPVDKSLLVRNVPDGKTVTPTDDIQIWLECAGINKPYTTLDEVLGDHESLQILMTDHNAVDYMVRSTTWATDVCADANAMRYIGRRNYAADTLLADEDWSNAIVNSEYVNFILNISVPTMTGPTSPSGEASSSSNYGGNNVAYKAFDKNTGTNWAPSNASGSSWLQYAFDNPMKCHFIKYYFTDSSIASRITSAKFQASNSPDFSNPVDLTDAITSFTAGSYVSIKSKNNLAYKYFRFVINNATNYPNTAELDFIGRQDVDETKVMLYGANQDSFYYKDASQQDVPLTTLSTTEKEISKSDLPLGEFKLYSSVAKNPDDLTKDFCKTFKNDDNLIEVMMRPENALYWYGYKDSNLESMSSANGWSDKAGNGSVRNENAPVYNTNNIYLSSPSSGSKFSGIGAKNQISSSIDTIFAIAKNPDAQAISFGIADGKSVGAGGSSTQEGHDFNNANYALVEISLTSIHTGYIYLVSESGDRTCYVQALWYN